MTKLWFSFLICLAIVAHCHGGPTWGGGGDGGDSKEDSEDDAQGNGMELISESEYSDTEYESENDSHEDVGGGRPAKAAEEKKMEPSKRTIGRPQKSDKPRVPPPPGSGPQGKKSIQEDRDQDGSKLRCYSCSFIRGKTDAGCIDPSSSNSVLMKCDTPRSSCYTALVRRDNNMLDAVVRGCARSPSSTDPDTIYCRTDRCNSLPYNFPELINFKNQDTAFASSIHSLNISTLILYGTCIFLFNFILPSVLVF